MKKSLFLSLAALAFAGSVSAQFVTTNPLPTADPTQIIFDGTKTGAAQIPLGTSFRTTVGGEYVLNLTGTNWKSVLGDDWASTIQGSQVVISENAAYTPSLATNGPANSPSINILSYVNPAVAGSATTIYFKEEAVALAADGGGALCPVAGTATLTNFAAPTVTMAMLIKVFCSTSTDPYNADFTFNNPSLEHWAKVEVKQINGTGATQYAATTVDFAPASKNTVDLKSYADQVGVYQLILTNAWDAVSAHANNADALYTGGTQTINFAVLPTPQPVLKSNVVK